MSDAPDSFSSRCADDAPDFLSSRKRPRFSNRYKFIRDRKPDTPLLSKRVVLEPTDEEKALERELFGEHIAFGEEERIAQQNVTEKDDEVKLPLFEIDVQGDREEDDRQSSHSLSDDPSDEKDQRGQFHYA